MKDILRQLYRDLRNEKLRTFLTIFGIVWGTVAISLMLAFGTGLHKQLVKNTAGLGDRIMIIWPGLTSIPHEGLGKGRRLRVTEDDIEAIRKEVPGLKRASGEYMNSMRLDYGTKTLSVDISGVIAEFGEMRNLIPESGGRFLNPIDDENQRRVIFLGDELKTSVFGESDAIGKIVLLNQSPFTVVGVLKKKPQDSSYSGRDKDKAFIPSSTFRALSGDKYVDNIVLQGMNAAESEQLIERLRTALAGPLGSVGDRLIWAGWLPFCSLLALTVYGFGGSPVEVLLTFLGVFNVGHVALRVWGLRAGWKHGMRVAQALGNPVLRRGPDVIAPVAAFVAGLGVPLAMLRVIGPGRTMLGVVLVAAAVGAVVIVRLQGRLEGWKLALGVLSVLLLASVVR